MFIDNKKVYVNQTWITKLKVKKRVQKMTTFNREIKSVCQILSKYKKFKVWKIGKSLKYLKNFFWIVKKGKN